MSELKLWFLDVGHGDCTYISLPNNARMMIDCGCGDDHWPSKMLNHYKINKVDRPVHIPGEDHPYGLDKLVITHPHGDHISDIQAIHDEIGFWLFRGGYSSFIDKMPIEKMDFRKRNEKSVRKFVNVVKEYTGQYDQSKDRTISADPPCSVQHKRFISYEEGIDLNELSWFTSLSIGGHKVLFTGDMPASGIKKILQSDSADDFKKFVSGTTVLKVPHHGRENGCSQELFDAFGEKPLLCIVSDEVLSEANEGTSATQWYSDRTSEEELLINGIKKNRRVLTTRSDKDIYVAIDEKGALSASTNCFGNDKETILNN